MPRDDREQTFEKALARSLGSSGAAVGSDCLDAETLAAYHERLLSPEEMAQHKAHIATCERCQEVLTQLEATDRIAVEADRDLLLDQIVLEAPETEHAAAAAPSEPALESASLAEAKTESASPSAETPSEPKPESEPEPELDSDLILDPKLLHDPELVPTSAPVPPSTPSRAATHETIALVSAAAAKAGPTSSTISFRSPRQDRPKMVRYVAIAGALAAGLILWFVYYRDQSSQSTVALNQPAPKMELPSQSSVPPSESGGKAKSEPSSEPNAAASQGAAVAPTAQPRQALSKSPADSASNALDDGKSTLDAAKALEQKARKDAAAQAPAFIPSGQDDAINYSRDKSRAKAANSNPQRLSAANQSPVDKALADARAVLQPTSNSPSGIPATPPPARTKMNPGVITESAAFDAAAPPAAMQKSASTSQDLARGDSGRFVASLTPLSVPAPSGKTIWRIGQAGMIQHSTNSGTTWSIQPSGVVTDLIAGSAYSDQICWLVGRNGTILRTTDGGATWEKLASPSSVDLLGVFAINGDSATITDAAGRAFETTSAGARWTRTTLQQ